MNQSDTNGWNEPQPAQSHPAGYRVHLPASHDWVIYALVGLTVVVYLLQILSQYVLGYDLPVGLGVKSRDLIDAGQFWRLLTPVFLHGSILHIAFNMYALISFGRGLVRFFGTSRFLLLYFLGAFGGNVLSYLITPQPSLGASTAVFGLVAAEGVFVYRNRFLFGQQYRQIITNIVMVVGINLVLGLNPGIDNWGHLGGLLAGLLFTWFAGPIFKVDGISPNLKLEDQRTPQQVWLAAVVIFGLLAGLALTRLLF
ncbi:MAG: rhomboid family intramembrane serine protease [Anaerolineae bacterium]|nr:rhomboid family intramembrane serine protease [Anaerolineae bacterium]